MRAILCDGSLPQSFWGEAINTIVYLKNRSPSALDKNTTPEEAWSGVKTDVSHLRSFGSIAYVYNTDPKLKKLDNKSVKCKYMGYAKTNQYRFWDIQKRRVIMLSWVEWQAVPGSKESGGGVEPLPSYHSSDQSSESDDEDSWEFFTDSPNEARLPGFPTNTANAENDESAEYA